MNNNELSFSQWATIEEIKLRGRVVQMSADMEFLMLKIIVTSLLDAPDEAIRKYRRLTMNDKIKMMNHDLKKYHPDIYKDHIKTIKYLDNINTFRTKFAHFKIEWDRKTEDKTYFSIFIFSNIKGKERPSLIKMTFKDYNEKAEKMRLAIMELLVILQKIETGFNQKYPDFFNSPSN